MLDSSVCIGLIRSRDRGLPERLQQLPAGAVAVSTVTVAELAFGVERSQQRERNRQALALFLAPLVVQPFDAAAAEAYGRVRERLAAAGTTIGSMDMMIAAHAISRGAQLVTLDARDFGRVEGLAVVDWR